MYRIEIKNGGDPYEYGELIKVFVPPGDFLLLTDKDASQRDGKAQEAAERAREDEAAKRIFIDGEGLDKNGVKRLLYKALATETGFLPPWGILTGVRPVKLMRELAQRLRSAKAAVGSLKEDYLLSEEKAALLEDICRYQAQLPEAGADSFGLYIGIPFCPTRCLYCSFTSNQQGEAEIEKYLKALHEEIEFAGRAARRKGLFAETVYFGGGTPTTLTAGQLDELLTHVEEAFDLSRAAEMTVEAGRPDTITEEKLRTMISHGIRRISINPQTSKDKSLELIGRSHRWEDVKRAFAAAKSVSAELPAGEKLVVNSDVIAGLPEETTEDFIKTLTDVTTLGPDNVTVHTLAVKKASRLIEADENYHYRRGDQVSDMLATGEKTLLAAGFRPYYLYRQKHMAGALENVGYCKGDTPCLYNVRIMDERQSILALGAGGISKKYYPEENRLERVANVSNYSVYIERLAEMKARKTKNFFEEVQ